MSISREEQAHLDDGVHQEQAIEDGKPNNLDRVPKYSRIDGEQ
jgi:hypothetical protein